MDALDPSLSGNINVLQGTSNEVWNHFSATPAPMQPKSTLVPAIMNEGYAFVFSKKLGGAFNNLRLMSDVIKQDNTTFHKFMQDCVILGLIGGPHQNRGVHQRRPFAIHGRAPAINNSRLPIDRMDDVYVVIWEPSDQIYADLFAPKYRPNANFAFPLIIGGKALGRTQIKSKLMAALITQVVRICSPAYQLAKNPNFNPEILFTQTAKTHDPKKESPLYLNPNEIPKFLSSHSAKLSPLEMACYIFIRIWLLNTPAGISFLDSIETLSESLMNKEKFNKLMNAFSNVKGEHSLDILKKTDDELKQEAHDIYTNLTASKLNALLVQTGGISKPNPENKKFDQQMRLFIGAFPSLQISNEYTQFYQLLDSICSSYIYPLGKAITDIGSEQRGTLDILTRS